MGSLTVGLDIGTTSIKAVAVDHSGAVVARARVPHSLIVPAPGRMEHDAERAWWRGPRRALKALGEQAATARAVGVTAMVPSLAAVDPKGRPLTHGLLYGDERGRGVEGGEVAGFLSWCSSEAPAASAFLPAQCVANRAPGGAPVLDWSVVLACGPFYGPTGWDESVLATLGVGAGQLPTADSPGAPAGRVGGRDGPVLAAGSADVWCEQLVADADNPGDVHVICGTTLVVWSVTEAGGPPSGVLWTIPHPDPAHQIMGGASNAGGLFLNWARGLGTAGSPATLDPGNVPVWIPYPRGERTPYHDPDRRASMHDLDLTHGPAAIQRAAYEAAGFVVRHHIELAGAPAKRIVATGGGTRVEGWMQTLADTTGLPVHVAGNPEGAAMGAAFLARLAAGLESDFREAVRWATTREVLHPDPKWAEPAAERYRRFLELSG